MGRQDLRLTSDPQHNKKNTEPTKCGNAPKLQPTTHALLRGAPRDVPSILNTETKETNQTTVESCILHLQAAAASTALLCSDSWYKTIPHACRFVLLALNSASMLQLPDLPQHIRSPDLFFKSKSACV